MVELVKKPDIAVLLWTLVTKDISLTSRRWKNHKAVAKRILKSSKHSNDTQVTIMLKLDVSAHTLDLSIYSGCFYLQSGCFYLHSGCFYDVQSKYFY